MIKVRFQRRVFGTIKEQLVIHNCPKLLRSEIKDEFTFSNPKYAQTLKFSPYGTVSENIPEKICLAEEGDRSIQFPRGFNSVLLSTEAKAQFDRIVWGDERVVSTTKFPQLLCALNREQKFLFKSFKKHISTAENFGNFLYASPTGTGKTIFLCRAAKELGQKTLILYNTDQIKRAWYEGLEIAFGLAPKDIGIIQQSKWKIGDLVTIASIQTLSRRRHRWTELFNEIGTLIVDEADLVQAPSYWNFIFSCPASYVLGATATDRGTAQMNAYLKACFGKTRSKVYSVQRDTDTSMALKKVEKIPTDFQYQHNRYDGINWTNLSENMMRDEDRNTLIIHHVIKDLRNNIPVLLTTKRVEHVETLLSMLKERGVKSANKLTGETNQDRVYTEKLVQAVKDGKVDCVVASIAAIKRGANLNPLAALHMAMPIVKKNDIEQLIGRIRRKTKGKTECKLVYYYDHHVPYLFNVFKRGIIPVLRRLKVGKYHKYFVA